jgi:hypothetical protein
MKSDNIKLLKIYDKLSVKEKNSLINRLNFHKDIALIREFLDNECIILPKKLLRTIHEDVICLINSKYTNNSSSKNVEKH